MIVTDRKDKILLIEPPFFRLYQNTYSLNLYPLSLGYLGGAIRSGTDWEVLAYNADFHPDNDTISVRHITGAGFAAYLQNLERADGPVWKEIEATITDYRPTAVGISAKSQNFASALIVARLVRKMAPEAVVIMGGPHPTFVGAELLRHPEIDVCVIGEGETTMVELLGALGGRGSLTDIPGIAFRQDGAPRTTAPRGFIEDLDRLPFPHAWAPHLLKDYDQYPKSAFGNIFTIRGCPYNCTFCGSRYLWSRKPRLRSPASVSAEIQGLQRLGVTHVRFDDDTFGVDRRHLHALCRELKEQCPDLEWSCELHVKLIDRETVALMKSAGCTLIQVGIESGNNEILRTIRKNITIEEAHAACAIIQRSGIKASVFFMAGFPQETMASLNDTFAAIRKIPCYSVCFSIFTPYPGTETYALCRKEGLVDDDFDPSLYNHQSPKNYFCREIPPDQFRALTGRIEAYVTRKNRINRIKGWFSPATCREIGRLGLKNSLARALKVFVGER